MGELRTRQPVQQRDRQRNNQLSTGEDFFPACVLWPDAPALPVERESRRCKCPAPTPHRPHDIKRCHTTRPVASTAQPARPLQPCAPARVTPRPPSLRSPPLIARQKLAFPRTHARQPGPEHPEPPSSLAAHDAASDAALQEAVLPADPVSAGVPGAGSEQRCVRLSGARGILRNRLAGPARAGARCGPSVATGRSQHAIYASRAVHARPVARQRCRAQRSAPRMCCTGCPS